jgi:hypothetical protein
MSSNAIPAQLFNSNTAIALGIRAVSPSPVLLLCRKLLKAGHDPGAPMDCYRGDLLCIRIRSIGEAAKIEVSPGGSGFVRQPARTGPPVRFNGRGQP